MKEALKIVPGILYLFVGLISLLMAFKNLSAKRFLPFQEKAASKRWDEIESPLKFVILFLMRLTGLGFLIVAILLIVCPVVSYFYPDRFYEFAIPGIAFIYCTGLFVINYRIYWKTQAETPWKGSLYAMALIMTGIIIAFMA